MVTRDGCGLDRAGKRGDDNSHASVIVAKSLFRLCSNLKRTRTFASPTPHLLAVNQASTGVAGCYDASRERSLPKTNPMHDDYVNYRCPKDEGVILFREPTDADKLAFSSVDAPRTCPECNKAYYKWECKKVTTPDAGPNLPEEGGE